MEKSRRDFFKKGLMGSLVLGTASLSHSAKAVTSMVEAKRAKRVLMISLMPCWQKAYCHYRHVW